MNPELQLIAASLPINDLRCLAAAEGYVELGMYEEALIELQDASAQCHELPLVQTLELCVCAGLTQQRPASKRRRKAGTRT
jgi:hypothetical protein